MKWHHLSVCVVHIYKLTLTLLLKVMEITVSAHSNINNISFYPEMAVLHQALLFNQ